MNIRRLSLVPALLAGIAWLPAAADDTDLYLDPNSALGTEPLVMFNIDYGSNFTSTICGTASTCPEAAYFRRADAPQSVKDYMAKLGAGPMKFNDQLLMTLMEVFEEQNKVKVGLMMSHNDTGCVGYANPATCSNGGYILMAFDSLADAGAEVAKAEFLGKLEKLPQAGGKNDHPFQGKETYFELYRYLKGQAVYNGHNGVDDFPGVALENIDPAVRWDPDAEIPNSKLYESPITAACSKIFVINIMFQVLGSGDDSDPAILGNVAGEPGMPGIQPEKNKLTFEDVLNYVRLTDLDADISGQQTIISYFVTKNDNTTTRGYARAGGTTQPYTFNESDPKQLVDALSRIFNEILSVSTTFVSASVPVNVFNRSESLDNVYVALFQAEATPFWTGNLKKLKIFSQTRTTTDASGNTTSEFEAYLVDANGNRAIASDGRIRYDALTHWTVAGSLPAPQPNSLEVAGKDGRVIDRGGAGQKLPGFLDGTGPGASNGLGNRNLFYGPATVSNGAVNALLPLNVSAAPGLKTLLDTTDDAYATTLVKYARGMDTRDADGDFSFTDARPWILGDPLHSRPLPINYGDIDGSDETVEQVIYIAMGSQDGFMHFFRDSDGTDPNNETGDGEEVWGFMPRTVMDKIKIFYENTGDKVHPYTVDGAPSIYLHDDNKDGNIRKADNDMVLLYFGLRRGGKAYYALDITEPENPHLKWRIRSGDIGFDELGQTWSIPRVGKLDPDGEGAGEPIPIVVFAGGYDENKDTRSVIGSADSEGNAIYIVNAKTGELIWKATEGDPAASTATVGYHAKMTDSIPSDVTLVDTDGDSYSDRILVGDTGGKVWRVDMGGAKANWKVSLLASLGSDTVRAEDRRFFHAPDIVQSHGATPEYNDDGTIKTDADGEEVTTDVKFDAIIIGSGDRTNPLDRPVGSTKVQNWMFMIKDPHTTVHSDANPVTDLNRTFDQLKDITSACMTTACKASELQYGWKLELAEGPGEKSLSTPLTVGNTVYFTTYLPLGRNADLAAGVEEKTCGPAEGRGLVYAVNLADGAPTLNYNQYNDTDAADGEALDSTDRFRQLPSGGIPSDVVPVTIDGHTMYMDPGSNLNDTNASNRWRTFWYNVEDADNY